MDAMHKGVHFLTVSTAISHKKFYDPLGAPGEFRKALRCTRRVNKSQMQYASFCSTQAMLSLHLMYALVEAANVVIENLPLRCREIIYD
jgi:hypothetical protein